MNPKCKFQYRGPFNSGESFKPTPSGSLLSGIILGLSLLLTFLDLLLLLSSPNLGGRGGGGSGSLLSEDGDIISTMK